MSLPQRLIQTEQLLKFGTVVPLMLILGNHLGNFLPIPLITETRTGNTSRRMSIILIFVLILISFYGSVDYTFVGVPNKALWPILDLFSSVFAMIALLMMMRFTHKIMYAILTCMILLSLGIFYSAKKEIESKLKEDGTYDASSTASKRITIVKTLMILIGITIVVFYLMSLSYMNHNYSKLYDTTILVSVPDVNGLHSNKHIAHIKPEFGISEYMFTPKSVKDPDLYNKLLSRPIRTQMSDFNIFDRKQKIMKDQKLEEQINEYVRKLKDNTELMYTSDVQNENLRFIANRKNISGIDEIIQPSSLWK